MAAKRKTGKNTGKKFRKRKKAGKKQGFLQKLQSIAKAPHTRYFGGFVLGLLVFYAFYTSPLYVNNIEPPFLNGQAEIAAAGLNLFGYDVAVVGTQITNRANSVDIKAGCDGLETIAIFLCAILFTPFAFKYKWPGMLAGLGILLVLNILRIIGLWLAGLYWPAAFDALHLHGGFVLFLFIALIIWFVWANWAGRKSMENVQGAGAKTASA